MPAARPLTIIHVAATPTGAPWMVALMREQQRLGHEVAAILPSLDGGIAPQLAALGMTTHAAGVDIVYAAPGPIAKLLTLARLVRLLRRLRPDVVHSHIFNSVVTTRLAAWLADVPVRLAGNAHPLSLDSDVLRPLEIGTAFCDTYTIPSCRHSEALMLAHGLPREQVRLIYYAVDQSGHDPGTANGAAVRHELGIPEGAPVVGKIAYFYPPAHSSLIIPAALRGRGIKGHEVLIRAIPLVLQQVPDATFILIGRGWGPDGDAYEHALKALVASLGISHAVLFPGERPDVPNLLAAFDVSVHCSLSDNLAGTVESLLMAKPLVVSDIPGFRDTVLHEQTGLCVPSDDPAALAAGIVRLLQDRTLARTLGENGRRLMLERFTLERTAADTEALLAGTEARAGTHYRSTTTVARTVLLPFRLARPLFEVLHALHREGVNWPRVLGGVAYRRLARLAARVLPRSVKDAVRRRRASAITPSPPRAS